MVTGVAGGMNPDKVKIEREIETRLIFCSAVFFKNEQTISHLFTKEKGGSAMG